MKRARVQNGSVVLNRRFGTWNFLWFENGRRRSKLIGTLEQHRTREAASRAAEVLRQKIDQPIDTLSPRVRQLVTDWKREKMSDRFSTRLAYEAWLNNHVLPKWGNSPITALQAYEVEVWLKSLPLSAKSRIHVRSLIRQLWEYAMLRRDVPRERNPMELVTIKGATKRTRKPRSLTVEEFHKFVQHLEEPLRTIALVCVCFGLRISECLALKWSDVDWVKSKLRVERAIVRQQVDDVKTIYSGRQLSIDLEMLAVLQAWRQVSQFAEENDWIFASPVRIGRQPISYPWVWKSFQTAAGKAAIGKLGTHTLRHTYRSWLDAVGTGIAVQQKLMRHTDIRTTMNVYGDVVTDEEAQAHTKVVRMAVPKAS